MLRITYVRTEVDLAKTHQKLCRCHVLSFLWWISDEKQNKHMNRVDFPTAIHYPLGLRSFLREFPPSEIIRSAGLSFRLFCLILLHHLWTIHTHGDTNFALFLGFVCVCVVYVHQFVLHTNLHIARATGKWCGDFLFLLVSLAKLIDFFAFGFKINEIIVSNVLMSRYVVYPGIAIYVYIEKSATVRLVFKME